MSMIFALDSLSITSYFNIFQYISCIFPSYPCCLYILHTWYGGRFFKRLQILRQRHLRLRQTAIRWQRWWQVWHASVICVTTCATRGANPSCCRLAPVGLQRSFLHLQELIGLRLQKAFPKSWYKVTGFVSPFAIFISCISHFLYWFHSISTATLLYNSVIYAYIYIYVIILSYICLHTSSLGRGVMIPFSGKH